MSKKTVIYLSIQEHLTNKFSLSGHSTQARHRLRQQCFCLFSVLQLASSHLSTTGVVEWILKKFELHSRVNYEDSTVSSNGNKIEGKEKIQIIHSFNEGTFLEKHYIWPGTEEHYLVRDNSVIVRISDNANEKLEYETVKTVVRHSNYVIIKPPVSA